MWKYALLAALLAAGCDDDPNGTGRSQLDGAADDDSGRGVDRRDFSFGPEDGGGPRDQGPRRDRGVDEDAGFDEDAGRDLGAGPDMGEIPDGCVAEPEVCDGADNDCNGFADDVDGLGEACDGGAGILACDLGTGALACVPVGADGQCDGVDNDGDGAIDEEPPCNGCPPGTQVPVGYVCAPAGRFLMGTPEEEFGHQAEEPQHEVRITRPFLIKATEVTQSEWERATGSNPSGFQRDGADGCDGDPCDVRPVESVSWFDAIAFANARSAAEGLPPCYDDDGGSPYDFDDAEAEVEPTWPEGLDCLGYRLATEAEWEYAARAGTQGPYYVERGSVPVRDFAWYGDIPPQRTRPVGQLLPNPWDLFDVVGNVAEWVWDRFDRSYGGLDQAFVDPLGPDDGSRRVAKGGSYRDNAAFVRPATRVQLTPDYTANRVGLRLVRSVPRR